MPFCYGGGIKTLDQATSIIKWGVEKIAISSAALDEPELVRDIASELGSQSVVAVLDVRKKKFRNNYEVWTHNATHNTKLDPVEQARVLQSFGIGEIIVNSIDRDGTMKGYDLPLLKRIREAVSVPLTALGGAGTLDDVKALVDGLGVVGAAAGSMFVFKGTYKAVLINYPDTDQKQKLFA
jgi:cyclase